MKILHVLHHSLPQLPDGYAVRSEGLLRAQREMGMDVVALTGCGNTPEPGGEETWNGIRYIRTNGAIHNGPSGIREWKRFRVLEDRLKTVLRCETPDVLHVHSPVYNGLACVRAARSHNIPCVYEMRALWEEAAADQTHSGRSSYSYRVARWLETAVMRKAQAVVTICDGLRQEVISRKILPAKVFVVPNGVASESFEPRPPDENLLRQIGWTAGAGPVFGYIGSLFRFEGVEDLLAAIPAVLQRLPAARFVVVGGGERADYIRNAVTAWSGTGQVIYVPRVAHDDIHRYYSILDCAVYPRHSIRLTELVTPLKPLESMAAGKCVIASDIGGHREILQHDRTGLLFRPGDVRALSDTLCEIGVDSARIAALASCARAYVLRERNWAAVAANYLPAYKPANGVRR